MAAAPQSTLLDGQTVLFQGDSITDCGRNRAEFADLGKGYVADIAARLNAARPGAKLRILNRGVSGDRVKDLQRRWDADCLSLKPDWVTIFVGINDVWRRYDANDPTSAAEYAAGYLDLLTRTKAAGARLVLMEPFVVPHPPDRKAWREDLDPKIAAVHALATQFGAILVPLDALFATACRAKPAPEWAADGVHPTAAGHALIANAWLSALGAPPQAGLTATGGV